jgi:hypothetical protein
MPLCEQGRSYKKGRIDSGIRPFGRLLNESRGKKVQDTLHHAGLDVARQKVVAVTAVGDQGHLQVRVEFRGRIAGGDFLLIREAPGLYRFL